MGEERNREGVGAEVVLDAGALIAFERGDRRIRALVFQASNVHVAIVIPASALAQAWRGGPKSALLARLLAASEVDFLDDVRAREVGERLGHRDGVDIADAHVVCCAVERDAELVTSDPGDMEALAGPGENLVLVSV